MIGIGYNDDVRRHHRMDIKLALGKMNPVVPGRAFSVSLMSSLLRV